VFAGWERCEARASPTVLRERRVRLPPLLAIRTIFRRKSNPNQRFATIYFDEPNELERAREHGFRDTTVFIVPKTTPRKNIGQLIVDYRHAYEKWVQRYHRHVGCRSQAERYAVGPSEGFYPRCSNITPPLHGNTVKNCPPEK